MRKWLHGSAAAAALAAATAWAATSPTVRIEQFKYVPERIEVAAGQAITWQNNDLVPHTVTAPKLKLESGEIAANKAWSFTPRAKGEWEYICRLHPGMRGVLVVK